jgi:hypothetical protein
MSRLNADVCIAVSPTAVSYLWNELHLLKRKARLVNNAVPEVPRPSPARLVELRTKFGIEEGDFIIGSVGRVFDNKRFSASISPLIYGGAK